jgi:hypothetical protein
VRRLPQALTSSGTESPGVRRARPAGLVETSPASPGAPREGCSWLFQAVTAIPALACRAARAITGASVAPDSRRESNSARIVKRRAQVRTDRQGATGRVPAEPSSLSILAGWKRAQGRRSRRRRCSSAAMTGSGRRQGRSRALALGLAHAVTATSEARVSDPIRTDPSNAVRPRSIGSSWYTTSGAVRTLTFLRAFGDVSATTSSPTVWQARRALIGGRRGLEVPCDSADV